MDDMDDNGVVRARQQREIRQNDPESDIHYKDRQPLTLF
jgi:hypothetical protein